jgi:DNA topoisomerase VI subunit B
LACILFSQLVDNVQDTECQASKVSIIGDSTFYRGAGRIQVEDDGKGLTRNQLQRMMSYGYSDKENKIGNVGRYGIGFKAGSMRMGSDVAVLTRESETATVALLSQSFLTDVGADEIKVVPRSVCVRVCMLRISSRRFLLYPR